MPKFVAATRQATSNRPVLSILLKRMKASPSALHQPGPGTDRALSFDACR